MTAPQEQPAATVTKPVDEEASASLSSNPLGYKHADDGLIAHLWRDLSGPRCYRTWLLVLTSVVASYFGAYAVVEARHDRQMNRAMFERNTFITMVSSGNRGTFIAAMKNFGLIQSMSVPQSPPIFPPWMWLGTEVPNMEPLSRWALYRFPLCTANECSSEEDFRIDLREANLTNADLANVDLTTVTLADATLAGAKLTHADLSDADLSDADLTSADLSDATLKGTTLVRARLFGADLTDADFVNVDLTDANLIDANLIRASLPMADLTSTELTGLFLNDDDSVEAFLPAKMIRASLEGANLTGAYLPSANLTRANLTDANLTGANLTGADLTRAYLRGANLRGADLTGADLTGADLTGADLTGAALSPTSRPNVFSSFWDEDTVWPKGLNPPCPRNGPSDPCQ